MSDELSADPRVEAVLQQVMQLAVGNMKARTEPSQKGDALDQVITGLNMLVEEFAAEHFVKKEVEDRIAEMIEVLMNMARLDFSMTAEVSERSDQLDAMAVGLNMFGEELDRSLRRSAHLNRVLRAIRNVNKLIVAVKTPDKLLSAACQLLVETRGYQKAWALIQPTPTLSDCARLLSERPRLDEAGHGNTTEGAEDETHPMAAQAAAIDVGVVFATAGQGDGSHQYWHQAPDWACVSDALQSAEVLLVSRNSPECQKCATTEPCPFFGGVVTRIAHGDDCYGVLAVEPPEGFMQDEEELALFQEVASDLGFALHNIGQEAKRLKAEQRLAKAHEELKASTAQLIHAERLAALGQLAAGVAHELNQPLNGIRLLAQNLLRYKGRLEEGELERDLSEIVELVKAMAAIIENMRGFTRRSAGTEARFIDINAVVGAALRLVAQQVRDYGIELEEVLAENPPEVFADPLRMQQVVMNLLTNARDSVVAANKTLKRIEVSTAVVAPHGVPEAMRICVKDTGCGIADEKKQRIFEPFFTTKGAGSGTGLGLSIVETIVAEHKGSIEVDSTEGEQTTFTITLPIDNTASHERLS